jgi:pyrroline-5-carboxylate reductase
MTYPLRSLGSELQSYTMNILNIVRKMSNIISLIVGGTVDITAHEKFGEHKIAELCKAMRDDCGGTSVDKEFLQIFYDVVGKDLID